MSATSPPESFPVERTPDRHLSEHRVVALPRAVRAGNAAMGLGAGALVAGVLIEVAEGLLVVYAPDLFQVLGGLQAPLLTCGQVLLGGGAVAARLARRRAARQARSESADRG